MNTYNQPLGRALCLCFQDIWTRWLGHLCGGENVETRATAGTDTNRRIGQDECAARHDEGTRTGNELLIHTDMFRQCF